MIRFLESPASIRRTIDEHVPNSARIDAAVAFVGADWQDILGSVNKLRLICWLSSTNTNPYAVRQMCQQSSISVRQMDAMHAKVFILRGQSPCAIVGSANLSRTALSLEDAIGQTEAAVILDSSREVARIGNWFSSLWGRAKRISKRDIERAIDAWEKARSQRIKYKGSKAKRPVSSGSLVPPNWVAPRVLRQLATQASALDPEQLMAGYRREVTAVARRPTKQNLMQVIKSLASWTGHEGTYHPALGVSSRRVKRALATLFDRSRPVSERLSALSPSGPDKITGFGLMSVSMLLAWRYPLHYPPFNRRTVRFLKDFGLADAVGTSLTPAQYEKWVATAQDLSSRLKLPTAGHIDRLIWLYTKDLDL